MTEKELLCWLMLTSVPKIGCRKLTKLLAMGSAENIVGYSHKHLEKLGFSAQQISYLRYEAEKHAERCLNWRNKSSSNNIVTPHSPEFPPLLKEIASFPLVLFVKGRIELLSSAQIAIVGSRNASLEGLKVAGQFAAMLAESGLTITSGLALGIDGRAHDGALSVEGNTIAVLGSGLESVYPAKHRALAKRIESQGLLVSEFWPDSKPRAEHFPRRNRIISGLSLGVLIVEAAIKSGSLITARYAVEQNREVFVVPGMIQNANCRGSNALIQQGAKLVQDCDDILVEIENHLGGSSSYQNSLFTVQQENEQLPFAKLLANVGVEATPVDILAQRTNIPVHEIMMQLLELELQGHVAAVSGGYIRMRRG
ncbi:DNA-processing protein DprA [Vibrio sp. SCSIO 43137]|uniref:DNA-processing protein DprA n=1 Tax=Vibrio sp. SCSIO 43137 TaxID=3021011 RepID=UPI00230721C8|nr:DNA-processing protein DprA [Vibrio sp. SCSIO 43137]WCE29710.1 DNA-processing protein DprA [Vibrio sp. SCSIO 43137]